MKLDWADAIGFYTLVQLSFLSVVAYNYKKGKRLSNRILSGFMASNAILIAYWLLWRFQWISPNQFTVLFSIGGSSYLLLMPFLYLYICSLCDPDFRMKLIHLLHAIPFVCTGLFRLYANLDGHGAAMVGTLSVSQLEEWSYDVILHLQILSYIVASVVTLAEYRKRLKEVYSSIERIDLSWCNLLLAGFTAMWSLDLSQWILGTLHAVSGVVIHLLFLVSLLINLTFTLVVAYKGLVQSGSFSGIEELPKYAASRLKPSECDTIVEKLILCMKEEKPYLTPSLAVEDLAKKLRIPSKQLSQAIHTRLNQNFYDLINAYRIEEAKERMLDPHYQNQTLLAVAFDVGFNSKSVFNAAFKKHAGMTPKSYKSLPST